MCLQQRVQARQQIVAADHGDAARQARRCQNLLGLLAACCRIHAARIRDDLQVRLLRQDRRESRKDIDEVGGVTGFWIALQDLKPSRAFVIAPVSRRYPLAEGVEVLPVHALGSLLA